MRLFVGDGDFHAIGQEFLEHFVHIAALQPDDRVLDIGCGIGRMARVLVPVLRPPGSYTGFDINPAAIDWCSHRYRNTPATFSFHSVDVRNGFYNPDGHFAPSEFAFPYATGAFDLAIATSVFTHLLPDAAARYLSETARVLRPGGRLFSTWFITGAGSPETGPFSSATEVDGTHVTDASAPEAAIAYTGDRVRALLSDAELTLAAEQPGTWSGGEGTSYQNIVLAIRDGDAVAVTQQSNLPSEDA
ncbi:MAG TPA: methyltransferase domain-containing protein [Solirubrobacteraceae bacterium]|jgi:SAM-dependent methyltransferase|nr:methyltransferase domain-containing protein [Solirubrobacteraceae bacterium]